MDDNYQSSRFRFFPRDSSRGICTYSGRALYDRSRALLLDLINLRKDRLQYQIGARSRSNRGAAEGFDTLQPVAWVRSIDDVQALGL